MLQIKEAIDALIPDVYKTGLQAIGEIIADQHPITDLPEKCGLKKFNIEAFLDRIPHANKTIKEITLPSTTKKMNLVGCKCSH
jgi:hypothetical protein